MKPSALHLLRQADEHCKAASHTRYPEVRAARLHLAQRATLQALATLLGPCGVRRPVPPTTERGTVTTLYSPEDDRPTLPCYEVVT